MTHPCLASRKGETVEAVRTVGTASSYSKENNSAASMGACAVRSCPVCLVFVVIGEADLIAAGLIWGRDGGVDLYCDVFR